MNFIKYNKTVNGESIVLDSREIVTFANHTLVARIEQLGYLTQFSNQQLLDKLYPIIKTEKHRIRLENELTQQILQYKGNQICKADYQILDKIVNICDIIVDKYQISNNETIQSYKSDLNTHYCKSNTFEDIIRVTVYSQSVISQRIATALVQQGKGIMIDVENEEFHRYQKLVKKYMFNKDLINQNQNCTVFQNICQLFDEFKLTRCIWRQEELKHRGSDVEHFLVDYKHVQSLEDQKNKKITENYRLLSQYNKQLEFMAARAKARLDQNYKTITHNTNEETITRQINKNKIKVISNTQLNELPQQYTLKQKSKQNTTFHQQKPKYVYPAPPDTSQITSYADVKAPIIFKHSAVFDSIWLQKRSKPGANQFDSIMLSVLKFKIIEKKLLSDQQKQSSVDKLVPLSSAKHSTSTTSIQELQKHPSQQNDDNNSIHSHKTGRSAYTQSGGSVSRYQYVQLPIPLEVSQQLQVEIYQITKNHWMQLQESEPPELQVSCSKCIIQASINQAIEQQKNNTSHEMKLVNEWGERVLQVAAQQKLPEEYAPVLTKCARYIQYYNTSTGETINIHPEVKKVQKMISEQYYRLEACVQLKNDSQVLNILNPLNELTSYKLFFNPQIIFNSKLTERLSQNIQEQIKFLNQELSKWIKW